MQFVAIATILNLTMGIGMTAGILISWLMLTAKTYIGGLKAVIWQDAVHGTIQTVGVFILFFVILYASGGFNQISANVNAAGAGDMLVPHFSGGEMLVFFFTLGAYQLVRQDLWRRFWAAKNENIAIKGYWASIIVGFLVGVVVVATGVYARYGLGLENINPTFVYYEAD